MDGERVVRIIGVSLALALGLGVGLAVSVWAGAAGPGAGAGRGVPRVQDGHEASANVPQVTSTPVLIDLAARLGWDSRFACPGPVLDLTSYVVQPASCPEHYSYVMRLENSNGEWRVLSAGLVQWGPPGLSQV